MEITGYQIFLFGVLVTWPLVIAALLFLMSRIEARLERSEAETPEEAGLEPVAGQACRGEVTIVFGDKVIGGRETKQEAVDTQHG